LCTVTLKGQDGAKQIGAMMEQISSEDPREIGSLAVTQFRDYREGVKTDLSTGEKTPTGLPRSDVLYFDLENRAWCCIRPSGTEPKIKFYIGVRGMDEKEAEERLESLTEAVKKLY